MTAVGTGVYVTEQKSGKVSYRSSLTYKNKHIALGSYDTYELAKKVYEEGCLILADRNYSVDGNREGLSIPFEKFVILINFRDNGIYSANPLYIRKNYISYYLSEEAEYKFSVDDLFYYATHRILKRGGHMYVNDYGMQVNLKARYGIKNYAAEGRDYRFINGDRYDMRYENLEILNTYNGVEYISGTRKRGFRTKIHLRSDLIVGYYDDAIQAAIAYNKAIDILKRRGCKKEFEANYLEGITGKTYADIYSGIKIGKNIENRRETV